MFRDIKVGDTVLLREQKTISWRDRKTFFLPNEVTKVTPKLFYIKEKRFKKVDGSRAGSGSNAYFVGQRITMYGEDAVVSDQSDALQLDEDMSTKRYKISQFGIKIQSRNVPNDTLDEALILLMKVKEMLKEYEIEG